MYKNNSQYLFRSKILEFITTKYWYFQNVVGLFIAGDINNYVQILTIRNLNKGIESLPQIF